MNKKKFLAMLVSLCLVAALGVGATLALFSDTTNKLTNTFVVGNGITATLQEVVDEEGTVKGIDNEKNEVAEDGKAYEALQPLGTVVKEPYMVVKNDSAKCYCLVKVTGIDELEGLGFTVTGFDVNVWKQVKADETGKKDGVYMLMSEKAPKVVDVATEANFANDKDETLDDYQTANLFTNVTMNNLKSDEVEAAKTALTGDEKAKYDIVMVGCAVQAENADQLLKENDVTFDTLEAALLSEAVFE